MQKAITYLICVLFFVTPVVGFAHMETQVGGNASDLHHLLLAPHHAPMMAILIVVLLVVVQRIRRSARYQKL